MAPTASFSLRCISRWTYLVQSFLRHTFVFSLKTKISPAKRLRLFFQNNILHDTVDSQALCQEDLQCPADWKPLSIHDKGKFRDVFIKPFMRPLEVLSDTALRYSWTSCHPAALLWRTSYWHTHERFAVIANMFTDSSVPAFQWSDFIPAIYYPAWRRFLSCFYNKTSSREGCGAS